MEDARRKFALWILYVDTLLIAMGFFMLAPLLSVHFIQNLHWTAAAAGTILAINGFTQQGMKLPSGMLADRIGYKRAILLGLGVRALGYTLYGIAEAPGLFALAAFTSGLGGALFHPASFGAYARLTDETQRTRIYAVREMLSNTGFVVGPVVGMFLFRLNFETVCFVSATLFVGAGALTLRLLPRLDGADGAERVIAATEPPAGWRAVLRIVATDRRFLQLNGALLFVWAISSQMYLAVPARADSVMADSSGVAWLYAAAAAYMVALQVWANKNASRWLDPSRVLAGGSLLMAVGIASLGVANTGWGLLASILVFTTGQMVAIPTMNQLIAGFVSKDLFATYFGFNGLALALGGAIGNTTGGRLYDLAAAASGPWPWLSWSLILLYGIAVSTLCYRLGSVFDRKTT